MKEESVVKLPQRGGRGVWVKPFILTAAHCTKSDIDGRWAHHEEVETHLGKFRAAIFFVDPVSDIAVLGHADYQGDLPEDAAAFDSFCDSTEGFPLCRQKMEWNSHLPFPVSILNQDGEWMPGQARFCLERPILFTVDTLSPIDAGASGGPILNAAGELLALVSNGTSYGTHPYVYRALPEWILSEIHYHSSAP